MEADCAGVNISRKNALLEATHQLVLVSSNSDEHALRQKKTASCSFLVAKSITTTATATADRTAYDAHARKVFTHRVDYNLHNHVIVPGH